MLGIEFPILAFSHCRDVVAAVSNAGAFGVLGAVAHSPERLEIDLAWIEEQTKGRPYGVDLLLPQKYAGADEGGLDREAVRRLLPPEQQQFVDEILRRYEVPELPEGEGGSGLGLGQMSVSPRGYEPLLDVAFSHRIRLIASALGPPPPALIERAHAADVSVAALAGTRVHAERHRAAGVDLIVAQGTEAGGHTGEIATMVLVAEGVWCGSVWLTTEEAETHPAVKQKFLAAGSQDTVRSRSLTGKPARMLRSAWTDEWEREDAPPPLPMPLQSALVAPAQARIARSSTKEGTGANRLANYFVGQVVGTMNQVKPARQVVLEMVTEYAEVAQRFAEQVG